MNIPLGKPEIQAKRLDPEQLLEDIRSFAERNVIGYFCITIKGEYGLEEGLLIFENNTVIGAHYEYLRYGKEYTAGDAVVRIMNAFQAQHGLYDLYILSSQQIELLKIFNENLLFLEPLNIRAVEGSIPLEFSKQYEEQVIQDSGPKELSRVEILKRRKLQTVRIDNYDELEEKLSPEIKQPAVVAEVEQQMDNYLNDIPEIKPTPEAPQLTEDSIAKERVVTTETFALPALGMGTPEESQPAQKPTIPAQKISQGTPAPMGVIPKQEPPAETVGDATTVTEKPELPADTLAPMGEQVPAEEYSDEILNMDLQAEKLKRLMLKEKNEGA